MALNNRKEPSGGSTAYISREGEPIQLHRWSTLRGNKDYYLVRRYESEKFYVDIEWIGKVVGARHIPREYWKLYKVEVGNVIITGDRPGTYTKKRIEDPVLTKTFGDEKSALAYYLQTLVDAELLEVSEDYEGNETIVEMGNIFTQEPLTEMPISFKKTAERVESRSQSFGTW